MQKIRKTLYIALTILLLSSLFINCYATKVVVTKENLDSSIQEFVAKYSEGKNYKATVNSNTITISSGTENYNLNYTLGDKPTFSVEIPIKQGMTYAEYEEQTKSLLLPAIGYMAVANIQRSKSRRCGFVFYDVLYGKYNVYS